MALIRYRCYGMTSCGTGGIWALTDTNDIDNFFFGRTMIEDTSTSTKCFLQGRRSVYIPPTRGTNKQLMRAVPKVSLLATLQPTCARQPTPFLTALDPEPEPEPRRSR